MIMTNLVFHLPHHLHYGIGSLIISDIMKRLNAYFIFALLLFTACTTENERLSDISLQSEIINDGSELLLSITNNTKSDVILFNLKSEISPEIFYRESNNSRWINCSFSYYHMDRVPPDRNEAIRNNSEEELNYFPNNETPETNMFYSKVIDRINKSSVSLKSLRVKEFDEAMSSSVFLRQGESFYDTVYISRSYKRLLDHKLKFVFNYPSIYLDKTDVAYNDYFINEILGDSLGIYFPEKLDGYKIIYKEKLFHQAIIN